MLTKEHTVTEKVDPRVKRTRQLLMQAFSDLLKEKSFEDITVQDVTARATVNRATFYAHFDDKYALLDQAISEWFKQVLSTKLPADYAEFNAANLQVLIQIVCEFLETVLVHCKPSIRNQFDSQLEQQVKRQLYQVLSAWHTSTSFKGIASQDDAELVATATSWAIYGLALRWSQGERKESATEFARRVVPLISTGLRLPTAKVAARR